MKKKIENENENEIQVLNKIINNIVENKFIDDEEGKITFKLWSLLLILNFFPLPLSLPLLWGGEGEEGLKICIFFFKVDMRMESCAASRMIPPYPRTLLSMLPLFRARMY